MKFITVANIGNLDDTTDLRRIAETIKNLEMHPLSYAAWEAFPYKPDVRFSIAYNEAFIFLYFQVNEKNIRAVTTDTNGSVYEDSCVEFFVSFDETGYYNFECNCIGTFLVGFGRERATRQRLPNDVIEKIRCCTTIQPDKQNGNYEWWATWAIPLSVFMYHPQLSLSDRKASANFYKCGDKLPEPHYISWAKVGTERPDFHRPEYFGELYFT